jgi:hypothetical protein
MEISQGNSLCRYLKETKKSFFSFTKMSFFFFHKTREQDLSRGLVAVGRGGGEKRAWEGEYGANTVYSCMKMEK